MLYGNDEMRGATRWKSHNEDYQLRNRHDVRAAVAIVPRSSTGVRARSRAIILMKTPEGT
jgi:hypothetical protein